MTESEVGGRLSVLLTLVGGFTAGFTMFHCLGLDGEREREREIDRERQRASQRASERGHFSLKWQVRSHRRHVLPESCCMSSSNTIEYI